MLSRAALRQAWSGIRWVPDGNCHITLVFLGDQNPTVIDKIKAAVPRAVAGCRPFEIKFTGPCCFGRPERPKLVYGEIGPGRESLLALQASLKPYLEPLVGWEARPYRPHLTLGRPGPRGPKGPDSGTLLPPGMKNDTVYCFRVVELVLFSSELRPEGARYIPVETWNLEDLP